MVLEHILFIYLYVIIHNSETISLYYVIIFARQMYYCILQHVAF